MGESKEQDKNKKRLRLTHCITPPTAAVGALTSYMGVRNRYIG